MSTTACHHACTAAMPAPATVQAQHDSELQASCAKGEFLMHASRELRTSVHGILGFTRLLAQDATMGTEQQRQLGLIESCGRALLRLVEEMRVASALEPTEPQGYREAARERPAAPPAPARTADAATQPRRLLYVEDNPLNVLLMEALLAQRPHWQLRVAATQADALATAPAWQPHVLLLDMHLPDGSGTELLARLRAQHAALRAVPAIAVSGDALSEDVQAALDAGFDSYWTKPLNMTQVLAELDQRLQHVPAQR
jgi:CheY-like chemotaxis protein